jgi:hypothetical protein
LFEAWRSGVTHEEEIELGKELALYAADPLKFVLDFFPWDSDPELKGQRQKNGSAKY